MKVKLPYGKTGLSARIPDPNLVGILAPKHSEPLPDPVSAVREAIESPIGTPPLAELAKGKETVCIVTSDITRPVPNPVIVRSIVEALECVYIGRNRVTILIGTGSHRPNTGRELVDMFGEDIVESCRIESTYSQRADRFDYLGKGPMGTPIHIDKHYTQADFKIVTGLIEPHLLAGYSGGRKGVCPGIMSLETIRRFHSPRFIEDPMAKEGIVEGNPVHEEAVAVAKKAGVDFIVNVTLDSRKDVTGVFAGDMEAAWERGVEFLAPQVTATVPEPVDIVVTTAAGYPLDKTMYQSIKGLQHALAILKPGGSIVLASQMSEGIGTDAFTELMLETDDLRRFYDECLMDPDYFHIDQWMFESVVKVCLRAKVYCKCDGIDDETLSRCFMTPVSSVEEGIDRALSDHGPDAKIAVIPQGPYVIANVT